MRVVYVDDCPSCGCAVASDESTVQLAGRHACTEPQCDCHDRPAPVLERSAAGDAA